jgi:hypothetical protein
MAPNAANKTAQVAINIQYDFSARKISPKLIEISPLSSI